MDRYCGRMSGNSARAAFGLLEAGAGHRMHLLDTRNGENRTPAYLAINPMGKIPALVDGQLKLWESNAINWYVAEKHPAARLIPEAAEGRATMLRWQFFQAQHVTPACVPIFRATHPRLLAAFGPGDAAAADAPAKSCSAGCRCSSRRCRIASGSTAISRWPTSPMF